jgi:hypothetical protein
MVSYILCGDCIQIFWIYCDILYSGLWFLTIGIRALSRAGVVGNYFLFLQIFFFRRRKKRAATFQTFSVYFVQNLQKRVVYLSSSQKNTQFKKKNRPKRSPEGQDIEVLKSAIFRVFSADGGAICFYFCSIWRPNLPK